MKVAVVNVTTKIVENVIVASITDPLPENCFGVEVDEYTQISPGWIWLHGETFLEPQTTIE